MMATLLRKPSNSQSSMPKSTKVSRVAVINGPNLNLLGEREPEIYGSDTLDDITGRLRKMGDEHGVTIDDFQSNSEGECVERIQKTMTDGTDFIILNPGAFTHTSIAMRDALAAAGKPFIEVHLSNVFAREEFRRKSFLSDIAKGVISGLGAKGYELALLAAMNGGR